ncbi:MAG: hypothetical protein RR741_08965 [Erysipelotrichaceae bacterium]
MKKQNDTYKDKKENKNTDVKKDDTTTKNEVAQKPSETEKPSQETKPEESKPTPIPKPVCEIGENPNLPCDYIDLLAGYQVMDYETAKIKMAEADANGGGYDYGGLTRNNG